MRKLLLAAAVCTLAAGGIEAAPGVPPPHPAGCVNVVATTFPVYDWTREVAKGVSNVRITLLQQSGVDLHSYIPTAADMRLINASDLFIFVGGESDAWIPRALAQGGKPSRKVLNLMKTPGLDALEEEEAEGMAAHHHDHHDHHHHKEAPEMDEHIWLSLKRASLLAGAIAESLAAADPANAAIYRANATAYRRELDLLDGEYARCLAGCKKPLLVADRFPFRYLAEDYGLKYYAAFSGCSAESEASFKTIMFLARKMDEHKLDTIYVLEGSRHKIAETLVRTARRKPVRIVALDSLQSTTLAEAGAKRYIDAMRRNLELLKP